MSWIAPQLQSGEMAGFYAPAPFGEAAAGGGSPWSTPPSAGGDGYRANWWSPPATPWMPAAGLGGASNGLGGANGGLGGGIGSLVSQLIGLIGQLLAGSNGGGAAAASPCGGGFGGACAPTPGGTTFANATLASTGDPHLALTGTETGAGGATSSVNAHFDSMTGHRDLFSTNDFGDGFRVSTTTTAPNAAGVTYNQTATATMNGGRDRVSMGPGGSVSVVSDGQPVALAPGQSLLLAGGERVSQNADGSVTIQQQNARLETLATTFAYNGSGVDVTANAAGGVTLSGDLVRQALGT